MALKNYDEMKYRLWGNTAEGQFLKAAYFGDFNSITTLPQADVNYKEEFVDDYYTLERAAIHYVSENGHLQIVQWLLERRADVNLRDGFGLAAIHYAAKNGHLHVTKCLLENGADVNATGDYGQAAIHYAAGNGHLDVTKSLLENGADLSTSGRKGQAAIHFAARNGHLDVTKCLLENGADLNARDYNGRTALLLAKIHDREDIVELLLEAGAKKVKGKDKSIRNAAKNGDLERVRYLLEAGVDTDSASHAILFKTGWTALHMAMQKDYPDISNLLIQAGAAVNIPSPNDEIPLLIAAQKGNTQTCKLLVQAEAYINIRDKVKSRWIQEATDVDSVVFRNCEFFGTGWTALHMAMQKDYQDISSLLIQAGAEINIPNPNGDIPLLIAAQKGNTQTCKLLVQAGADINIRDKGGKTALHYGSEKGHLDVCKLLLNAGAPSDSNDEDGKTALHYGAEGGHLEVCELLLKSGAPAVAHDEDGKTALHYGAEGGHLEVCELLLKAGASARAQDEDGKTALHYGAKEGHLHVCELLLKAGAPADAQDKSRFTAEKLAEIYGHSDIKRLLYKIRLMQEVRNIGKEQRGKIKESYLPVKLFFVGPGEAGKTTLLNTLFNQSFSLKGVFTPSKKPLHVMKNTPPGQTYIDENFAERTIGVEVYSKVLEDIQLLIFDLGGQETFYIMQSIFLDLENSFFLLVIDFTKPKKEIEDDIKGQLSMISSKLPKHGKAEAILVGTHEDLLSGREKREIISACKSALEMNSYPNLTTGKTLFVNAKDRKTDDIKMLERYCIKLAQQVKGAMNEDMKTLPKFIVPVLRALQKASAKLQHKILDWETVLRITRKVVCKYGIKELAGIQVFVVASLLGCLGMVLVANPIDESHDLDMFESNQCNGNLIADIGWFYRDFLGTIYSPECFLKDPNICHDGYISQKYIDKTCTDYNIEKDVLISVLDYFHIILEHGVDEAGEKRFLIPSLLKRKQEDNMWTSFNEEHCPFYYIIGRTCLSSITLSPSTVTVLQHVLGHRGKDLHATVDFFQDGLFMAHEELIIVMNAVLLHNGVCIKIGVRKDACRPDRSELKSLIVKSRKLMDEFFTRMCCGIVREKNPSSSQERHVISLVGMMKGNDKISYPLSEVQHKFRDNVRLLHFCSDKPVKGDRTTLLLTQLETASKDNELVESQLNDYLEEILPYSSHGRVHEDCGSCIQSLNMTISGNVAKLHIGPSTIHVAESSKVTIGDNIEMNVHEN